MMLDELHSAVNGDPVHMNIEKTHENPDMTQLSLRQVCFGNLVESYSFSLF